MALPECCQKEAGKSLRKHFDVAVCDGCERLLLGYAEEGAFQLTVDELEDKGLEFEAGREGDLYVVAKVR